MKVLRFLWDKRTGLWLAFVLGSIWMALAALFAVPPGQLPVRQACGRSALAVVAFLGGMGLRPVIVRFKSPAGRLLLRVLDGMFSPGVRERRSLHRLARQNASLRRRNRRRNSRTGNPVVDGPSNVEEADKLRPMR